MPPISLDAYCERVAKYTKCSSMCFVTALIYMTRIAKRDPSLHCTGLSVHRLLLTGVLLSAKFLDDSYFNNSVYARVGGIANKELNRLELEMLRLLEFRLYVAPELVQQTAVALLSGAAAQEVLGEATCWAVGRKRRSTDSTTCQEAAAAREERGRLSRRTSDALTAAVDTATFVCG